MSPLVASCQSDLPSVAITSTSSRCCLLQRSSSPNFVAVFPTQAPSFQAPHLLDQACSERFYNRLPPPRLCWNSRLFFDWCSGIYFWSSSTTRPPPGPDQIVNVWIPSSHMWLLQFPGLWTEPKAWLAAESRDDAPFASIKSPVQNSCWHADSSYSVVASWPSISNGGPACFSVSALTALIQEQVSRAAHSGLRCTCFQLCSSVPNPSVEWKLNTRENMLTHYEILLLIINTSKKREKKTGGPVKIYEHLNKSVWVFFFDKWGFFSWF